MSPIYTYRCKECGSRIAELERTHHSMEDDSGRQYAVIPVEWINAAWEFNEDSSPEAKAHGRAMLYSCFGIVACEKCGGTKRVYDPMDTGIRAIGSDCDCPNNGWVMEER